jgi:hypothetical protein
LSFSIKEGLALGDAVARFVEEQIPHSGDAAA